MPRGSPLIRVQAPELTPINTFDILDSNVLITGVGFTDLNSISITLTESKTVYVDASIGALDTGNGSLQIVIEIDSVIMSGVTESSPGAGTQYMCLSIKWAGTLAAGAHTIKVRAHSTGTSAVQPVAEPNNQSSVLFVTE